MNEVVLASHDLTPEVGPDQSQGLLTGRLVFPAIDVGSIAIDQSHDRVQGPSATAGLAHLTEKANIGAEVILESNTDQGRDGGHVLGIDLDGALVEEITTTKNVVARHRGARVVVGTGVAIESHIAVAVQGIMHVNTTEIACLGAAKRNH